MWTLTNELYYLIREKQQALLLPKMLEQTRPPQLGFLVKY